MPDKTVKLQPFNIKVLIVIVKANLEYDLLKILTDNDVRSINILLGEGMRKFHLVDALGLVDMNKVVVISAVKSDNEKIIMDVLKQFLSAPESGIAFTVDIDAFAGGRTIFNLYERLIENDSQKPKDLITTGGEDKSQITDNQKPEDKVTDKKAQSKNVTGGNNAKTKKDTGKN
ncbi:MAG: hypothetical protein FWG51_05055 [Firmicutes bacterium]|nr:hypothetical protein [Bacillota bacterium]